LPVQFWNIRAGLTVKALFSTTQMHREPADAGRVSLCNLKFQVSGLKLLSGLKNENFVF
jgi:hypothetical protein